MQLEWVCRVKEEPVSLISQPYQLLKVHEWIQHWTAEQEAKSESQLEHNLTTAYWDILQPDGKVLIKVIYYFYKLQPH